MDLTMPMVPWGDVGFSGLVLLAIVSIIRGWLVPARSVKLITDALDKVIASKDAQIQLVTDANTLLNRVTDEQSSQISDLIHNGTTAHVAVEKIAEAANDARR